MLRKHSLNAEPLVAINHLMSKATISAVSRRASSAWGVRISRVNSSHCRREERLRRSQSEELGAQVSALSSSAVPDRYSENDGSHQFSRLLSPTMRTSQPILKDGLACVQRRPLPRHSSHDHWAVLRSLRSAFGIKRLRPLLIHRRARASRYLNSGVNSDSEVRYSQPIPLLRPVHREVGHVGEAEPTGQRALDPAETISGERKASERIMRTDRSLRPSRFAILSRSSIFPRTSSSSHWRAVATAIRRRTRASARITDRLGGADGSFPLIGVAIERRRLRSGGAHGIRIGLGGCYRQLRCA